MTDIGHDETNGDRTSDDGYWSWRFTLITKSYRGEIKGDERY